MKRYSNFRALLLLCLCLLARLSSAQEIPKHIDVTGTAEVKVAPDEVVLTLGIETTHKNVREAIKQNDERLKKLMAVLEKQGIDPKHIQPGIIRVTPNHEEPANPYSKGGKFPQAQQMPQFAPPNANAAPNAADPFGGQPEAASDEPKIKDYTARKTVVVFSKELAKLEQVLIGIYESNVASVGGIAFQTSALKKLRETLRTKAIVAAKDKAEALTAAISQKIGKAIRIEESNSDGSSSHDPFGPARPSAYRYAPPETTVGAVGIAPESITVSSSVTVWFELP
jgi:uncharacterized protein YggE